MGVDFQGVGLIEMPGDVHGHHTIRIDPGQERTRVETMVDRVDVYVVDVQQQVAIGFAQHGVGERDLVHVLLRCGVVGDVFHRQAAAENVLGLTDARGAVGIIQTLGPCLYEGDVAVVRRHTASRVACLRPGDEVAIKEKPWRPEVCVIASITSTSNEDGPMAPIEDHGY